MSKSGQAKAPTKPLDDDSVYAMVLIEAIERRDRFREVDEDKAYDLSESIARHGLLHPVMVRQEADGTIHLVHGGHRVRACEMLGLDYIKADFTRLPDEEARRIERDENFARNDLTKSEEALAAGSILDDWEAENGRVQRGGDRSAESKGQSLPFAQLRQDMADKSGKSERSIKDLLLVYRALGPDALKSLQGTAIEDNMVQLKALAKLPPEDRPAIVETIHAGDAASVKEAKQHVLGMPPVKPEHPDEIFLQKMVRMWTQGSKRGQDKFLKQIGAERCPKGARTS